MLTTHAGVLTQAPVNKQHHAGILMLGMTVPSVFTAIAWTWITVLPVSGVNSTSGYEQYVTMETLLVKELRGRLRERGRPYTRPVLDPGRPVQVNMSLDLIQLVRFDTSQQYITIHIWKRMTWVDDILQWKPSAFGGIVDVRFLPEDVWTPDISLYSSVEDEGDHSSTHVLIAHDGTALWMPAQSVSNPCAADTINFPYDQHTCSFEFGSWTHSSASIDLQPFDKYNGLDTNHYVKDKLWTLVDTNVERKVTKYICCPGSYSTLTFNLTLRRNSMSLQRTIIAPAVLLSSLSLLLFWIPADRPDRVTMGVAVFSAFFLLLLRLDNYIPPEADSRFGAVCGYNMLMTAVACAASVISVNVRKCRSPVPLIVKVLIDRLGTVLCVTTSHCTKPTVETTALNRNCSEEPKVAQPVPEAHHTWQNASLIIDRVSFILYLIGLILLFSLKFPWKYSNNKN